MGSLVKNKEAKTIDCYLMHFEGQLSHLSLSQRHRLVLEVQRKIESQLDKESGNHSENDFDKVFADWLPVEVAAQRELKKHGLPLKKKGVNSFKLLSLALFTPFILFALLASVAYFKFWPLIQFDEENGTPSFFGSHFNLNDIDGTFHMQNMQTDENGNVFSVSKFSGRRDLKGQDVKKISILSENGDFELLPSNEQTLIWSCDNKDPTTPPQLIIQNDSYHFDFQSLLAIHCEFFLPQGIPLEIEAKNIRLKAKKTLTPLKVSADNGKVLFHPQPAQPYRYNLSVGNGKVDYFTNSQHRDSYEISISLKNGEIINSSRAKN